MFFFFGNLDFWTLFVGKPPNLPPSPCDGVVTESINIFFEPIIDAIVLEKQNKIFSSTFLFSHTNVLFFFGNLDFWNLFLANNQTFLPSPCDGLVTESSKKFSGPIIHLVRKEKQNKNFFMNFYYIVY